MWTIIFYILAVYFLVFIIWFIYEIKHAPIMPDEYDRPVLKDVENQKID